jgi:hypothetical protein
MTLSALAAILWHLFLPLIVLVALVDLLTETPRDTAQRLRQSGLSYARIADTMGISPYRARKLLTA